MLRFFRSPKHITIVTILMIGVATWLYAIGNCEMETAVSGKYGTQIFNALSDWLINMRLVQVLTGLVLCLVAAVLLILVNTRLNLIHKFSYMPTLCYVLLVGGAPEIQAFNPVIFATILLIAGFIFLVTASESEELSYNFFYVSALISFATFFYQYMYVYMLVVWFVIAFWRPGYWREWVFSILGFALPMFFAFCWFFLINDDFLRIGNFISEIFYIQRVMPTLSLSTIGFFAFCIVIVFATFGYTLRYAGSKKTVIRTGYQILFLITVITVVMIFIIPDMFPYAWYLLAFPLSFTVSCYLATVRSARWATATLAALLAGVVVAQIMF